MKKQSYWKVRLKPNPLTKEPENDYIAEVSTPPKAARNEDLARRIVKMRSELRYETILAILNERDDAVRDYLREATPVQDGNIYLAPRITGAWMGIDPAFNPTEHKISIQATPTASLRKMFREEVGVQLLGKKSDGGARIGLVTDLHSGRTDGHITSGGDLLIRGEKIKIAPLGPPSGVFFVDAQGRSIPLEEPLTVNMPRKLICRIPSEVKDGIYMLRILTRFSSTNGILLNEPRTLAYDLPLQEGLSSG
jgi:hypothetical protein